MRFVVPPKSKEPAEPKRLNRTVGVADALSGVLDAALKKRGFVTRDILSHWRVIAPKPYDGLTMPDQLKWPRGAGHEGATLYLRVAPGHALAVSHEAPLIASAVNRYFGYLLVREVRLSAEPFSIGSARKAKARVTLPEVAKHAGDAVAGVDDPALKGALRGLGEAVLGKRAR